VFLDFATAIERDGADSIKEKYGNLFEMYERITGENPYERPMRIYPATHYTMGGLWVDYELQSNVPGLFVTGEANFSDHGANRLGASALMQGLADGYFVLPNTISNYLSDLLGSTALSTDHQAFTDAKADVANRTQKWLDVGGTKSPDYFHRELGKLVTEGIGMSRTKEGLEATVKAIPKLRKEFETDVRVLGNAEGLNSSLEKVGRIADFFELGELMARDALAREESCGGHFRQENQTPEGEALRDDVNFKHVAAWEYTGVDNDPIRHVEELNFETVKLSQRSYK
ncbi:MAG: FAD-binding protein, partial [Acidimicrobiales bacterium]